MYGNSLSSGAHKITTVLFVIVAIVIVVAAAKVVLDHVDSDGTVTGEIERANEEGVETLEGAGVYGKAKPRCR